LYYRIFYQISLCNEFIRESSDASLNDRGISGANKTEIQTFRVEARFLRALSYWHALDMFGSVPFVTEDDKVGCFFPEQISRADLYSYIESELLDIEDDLVAAKANEYARADQAAVWMLLSKLYLNAEVYINTAKYTECITYCNKVTSAGYELEATYDNLFLADNHNAKGVIFPVTFDGIHTRTWGGTTFIIHAAVGGTMDPAEFGIDGGCTNTVLASVNSDGNYEGYLYFADADNQFKYTDGPAWDVNYGDTGADGTLEQNGDNIVAGDAGYYKLIGSATPNGWDSDQDMTYDVDNDVWSLIVDLSAGEIKFRANDDWGLNYGDTDADGILSEGGDNIAISEPGQYEIKLYLGAPDYTYTVEKFSSDDRGMFHSDGQSLEIADVFEFTEGYACNRIRPDFP
jgi:hypothetical protein